MASSAAMSLSAFWGACRAGAQRDPDSGALRIIDASGREGEVMTYSELQRLGEAASAYLHSFGVTKGSIVFTAIPNSEVSVALSLGVARLGASWAPADEDLHPEQLIRLLDLYKPVVTFLSDSKIETLAGSVESRSDMKIRTAPSLESMSSAGGCLPEETLVHDSETAILLLTSGTTGNPKSVMTTNKMLLDIAKKGSLADAASGSSGAIYFGSPAWLSYSAIFLMAMKSSGLLVLGQAYVKDLYFDAVLRHKPSLLFFWPEVVVDFAALPGDVQAQFASFAKMLIYGGARTPAAALLKMVRALPDTAITQVYGSSEAAPISALTPADHAALLQDSPDEAALRHLGSAGKCIATVRIVDQENKPVPSGEVGFVHVLPGVTSAFEGYFKNEKATKEKFSSDGWIILGDLGRLDEDGYLYIEGRDSETIVLLSGDNVYPNEIEGVIAEIPGVVDVAVVKVVAGDSAISEVGAFVQVMSGAEVRIDDVRRHCEKRLGQTWSHPTHIFLQTEKLPRNRNGKCMKPQLSAQASQAVRSGLAFAAKCSGA